MTKLIADMIQWIMEPALYTELSPKLAIEYYVTDSLNMYASYGHSLTHLHWAKSTRYSDIVKQILT